MGLTYIQRWLELGYSKKLLKQVGSAIRLELDKAAQGERQFAFARADLSALPGPWLVCA